MRVFAFLLFTASALLAQAPAPAPGQGGNPPPQSQRPLWRVNLPAGTYEILVGSILGVSSHEYVIDGAARVTEVNVDTTGQFAVRFYALEPAVTSGPANIGAATVNKMQNLMVDGAERSGTDAWKKVVKSYPTTTHQRTVEYRVSSKASLNRIFTSASKCLRTGDRDELTITD